MNFKPLLVDYINDKILNHRSAIDEDQELLVSGILDSLAVMNLVEYIESLTGQKVPPLDITIQNFSSVQAIDDYLERQRTG